MPRGGKRIGAGRKPGSRNKTEHEKAAATIEREARREKARARLAAQTAARKVERAAERAEERRAKRDADDPPEVEAAPAEPETRRAIPIKGEILPPEPIVVPPGTLPREFLLEIMRNPHLPIAFRRDTAAIAAPYFHPKAVIGLKEARQLAALDDDDDELSAILRR
jgi:hypothetical protein